MPLVVLSAAVAAIKYKKFVQELSTNQQAGFCQLNQRSKWIKRKSRVSFYF